METGIYQAGLLVQVAGARLEKRQCDGNASSRQAAVPSEADEHDIADESAAEGGSLAIALLSLLKPAGEEKDVENYPRSTMASST